jgi:methylaspartate mutase sigma subunit
VTVELNLPPRGTGHQVPRRQFPIGRQAEIVICTIPSDAHSWNLIYLSLLLRELGYLADVIGPCTSLDQLRCVITERCPVLVVLSTVNGHGLIQAPVVLEHVRRQAPHVPVVAGGKLSIGDVPDDEIRRRLLDQGFDEVFTGPDAVSSFRVYLSRLALTT